MFLYKYFPYLFFLVFSAYIEVVMSQNHNNLYNKHSLRPVRKDDIMFKKSLWFRVDMRTRFNSAFFAENAEISRILINAVRDGQITPYMSDSLETKISIEEFNRRLIIPEDQVTEFLDFHEDGWDNESWVVNKKPDNIKNKKTKKGNQDKLLPKQLYLMELKEDLIFDKRESRMKHDLLAVTLVIPSEYNPAGIEKELASFSYKELILNNVFRNNPNAVWYNSSNQAEHRTLEEAFELGLFRGHLVKYENPQNNAIIDMYSNNKRALQISEKILHKLLEYEYLLWSY